MEEAAAQDLDLQEIQDLEALEMLHYHIAEALESLNDEFRSLCRAGCYGSETLIKSFHSAVDAGLFDSELVEGLEVPRPPLSEREARREIARLQSLEAPDRALLEVLQGVTDSRSADEVVVRLLGLAECLEALQPEKAVADREFAKSAARSVEAVYAPIAPYFGGFAARLCGLPACPGMMRLPTTVFPMRWIPSMQDWEIHTANGLTRCLMPLSALTWTTRFTRMQQLQINNTHH